LIISVLLLLFAVPELIAQLMKVTINLGPITYGPLPKIQLGKYVIHFKGIYWYLFIMVLIILIIMGTCLAVWSLLGLLR